MAELAAPVDLFVEAADGSPLRATLFEAGNPRAAIVVGSATAVPRGYYRAFAQYLQGLGATVLTYDYRGCGDPPGVLRRSKARMREWGTLDFAGVLRWMKRRYPNIALHVVGHSVGGHTLLQTPANALVDRAVAVASQSGHYRLYRGFERFRIYAFMAIVMPLLTKLYGYFPSRLLKFGDDMAPGCLYEWSRWCRSRGYFFDDPSMRDVLANAATLTAPVLMIGLSDDPWATPQAIDALEAGFTNAQVMRLEIEPREHGLRAVGHLGFFRSQNGERLWPIVTEFLQLHERVVSPGPIREKSLPAS